MNTYEVTLTLTCTYTLDAPNETAAIEKAEEWFDEAISEIVEIKQV